MAQAAYNSQTQYSRKYEDLRGVDLTSGQTQISPQRFAWAQNMWKDYSTEQGGAIETVPGFRQIAAWSGKKIYGVWQFRPFGGELFIMVHAGDTLYRFRHADRDAIGEDSSLIDEYTGLSNRQSTAFVFNGRFYILDGTSFRVFMKGDDGEWTLKDTADTAYLPVTFVNGEMYEQRNMISDRAINRETEAPELDPLWLYDTKASGLHGDGGHINGFAKNYRSSIVYLDGDLPGTATDSDESFDYIEDINEGAFEGDEGIETAVINLTGSDDINSIVYRVKSKAFAKCKNLKIAEVTGGIASEAFANCTSLKEVALDKGMSTLADVGMYAFRGCSSLEIIKLYGWGRLDIKGSSFGGCNSIREIYLGILPTFFLPSPLTNPEYKQEPGVYFPYLGSFQYLIRENPNYDVNAPTTIDNLPYRLSTNRSYIPSGKIEYNIVRNDNPEWHQGDTNRPEYIVTLPGTREYVDEDSGDTWTEDIDWSDPEEANKLPFKIEIGTYLVIGEDGKQYWPKVYRAVPEYQTDGTFGNLDSLEKVYTEYSLETLKTMYEANVYDDLYVKINTLQEDYGVEVVYETKAPNPRYSNTVARQAIVYDPADSVEQIHLDDDIMPESDWGVIYHTIKGEEYVDRVVLLEERDADVKLSDMFVDVELNVKPGKFATAEGYLDFASANKEYEGTAYDAIVKCTKSATFDGRIFLTGNPSLPNTVFYCSRDDTGHPNPAYWGALNYMNDGVGLSPNTAMLATSDMLMVLKGNDPHDATIYYHTGVDTDNDVLPRIYPSERGIAGVGCVGLAVNFRDDAVFMSRAGLEAVGKQQVNLERTLAHRSTLVDRMLTREDLNKAVAVEWEGYLMIFTPSGAVYMADSRQMYQNAQGNVEYEWYHMADVGVYERQTEDFEQITGDGMLYDEIGGHWLSEELTEAYAVINGTRYPIGPIPAEPLFVANADVYMSYIYSASTGNAVWYLDPELTEQARLPVALIGEFAYIVTESGRYSGGEFKSVTAATEADGLLYFGTENGTLCCFNTDKRGVAYQDEPVPVGSIHPNWYTFNNRQIDSYLTTTYDSAGFPDLAKKTVKKSLIVHAKTFPGSRIEVRVRTDRNEQWRTVGGISVATYDFFSTDYASAPLQLADETLSTIREKEKKWALKQLYFGSVGFRAPWGLYDMGYRFTVTGRIKT